MNDQAKPEHSPGPWEWESGPGTWSDPIALTDADGDSVLLLSSQIHDGSLEVRIVQGNWRRKDMALVASAPDLLAACEAMVEALDDEENSYEAQKLGVAAIANAKGEQAP